MKQAASNIVDAQGQPANKSVFRDMLKTMPHPFVRTKKQLRFLTSVNAEIDYKDSLSERATAVGDKYVELVCRRPTPQSLRKLRGSASPAR